MSFIILSIGILAQIFYTARILVQWIMSERAHKVVSPTLFWICSIIGSMLLFLYGYLREDFSILFGELLSYYIYMWNLKAKGVYIKLPSVPVLGYHISLKKIVPIIQILIPVAAVAGLLHDPKNFSMTFIHNSNIPLWAVVWGSLGQFIYKMRFVYQWWYSYRRGNSFLPRTFWLLAVVGSTIIISYALFRLDWILLIGQVGIVASIRNLIIGHKEKKEIT